MRYTRSKQGKLNRHSDSGYRIREYCLRDRSDNEEWSNSFNVSTTSAGEGSREHGLALGRRLGRLS